MLTDVERLCRLALERPPLKPWATFLVKRILLSAPLCPGGRYPWNAKETLEKKAVKIRRGIWRRILYMTVVSKYRA